MFEQTRISIHALREEGDGVLLRAGPDVVGISIHALREEGDGVLLRAGPDVVGISIHALREEGDLGIVPVIFGLSRFLSTPSARRATVAVLYGQLFRVISIHALREEGDSSWLRCPPSTSNFYPRPPRGGRPAVVLEDYEETKFLSTPSARRATGSAEPRAGREADFYPRPPRGGRPPAQ